jgi:hypothetical protein
MFLVGFSVWSLGRFPLEGVVSPVAAADEFLPRPIDPIPKHLQIGLEFFNLSGIFLDDRVDSLKIMRRTS